MDTIKWKIEAFFQELRFNEKQHRYSVNGQFMPSVSKLIKNVVEPFDAKNVSKYSAIKQGKTQEEVLAEWDEIRNESTERGHRVHDFAERYMWNRQLKPRCGQERAVVKFWNDLPKHIIPVFAELKMYHKEFRYAGTADVILFNTHTGTFIIADYKTNKDLFKNYKEKKMLYPFNDLLDMPYNKYQLQFSYYQLMFEQIGLQVSSRKLIWLEMDGNYKIFNTDNYTKRLVKHLAEKN